MSYEFKNLDVKQIEDKIKLKETACNDGKNNLPRPKNWSGWCLSPLSIEFWLGDEYRIHERLKYNKVSNNWKKEILYP